VRCRQIVLNQVVNRRLGRGQPRCLREGQLDVPNHHHLHLHPFNQLLLQHQLHLGQLLLQHQLHLGQFNQLLLQHQLHLRQLHDRRLNYLRHLLLNRLRIAKVPKRVKAANLQKPQSKEVPLMVDLIQFMSDNGVLNCGGKASLFTYQVSCQMSSPKKLQILLQFYYQHHRVFATFIQQANLCQSCSFT
jgi:hypothetical protein